MTPLMVAVLPILSEDIQAALTLIQGGTDVNIRDYHGMRAVDYLDRWIASRWDPVELGKLAELRRVLTSA